MSPEAFFLIGALCATHAFLASFRGRPPFAMAWFLGGWLTGELALFHLGWQAGVVAAAVSAGALDAPIGQVVARLHGPERGRPAAGPPPGPAGRADRRGRPWSTPSGPTTRTTLGRELLRHDVPRGLLLRPFRFEVPDVEVTPRPSATGRTGAFNTLDVYRRRDHTGPAPTLVHVHGGSWMHGRKERQAKPLTWHLAQRGLGRRLASTTGSARRRPFPNHLDDVRAAVTWVRDHADELGVDPGFIVLTGGSAGGHLAALAALDPVTGVQGCVPLLRHLRLPRPPRGARPEPPAGASSPRSIMKCSPDECPERWDEASPIAQVGPRRPTVLRPPRDVRLDGVRRPRPEPSCRASCREAAAEPVAYAELPGAQHAFDTFHTVRATHVVNGVARWLAWLHARHLAGAQAPRFSTTCDPTADAARSTDSTTSGSRNSSRTAVARRTPGCKDSAGSRRPRGSGGTEARRVVHEAVDERAPGCPPSAPGGPGRDHVAVELGRDVAGQATALVDGGPVRAVEDHLDRGVVARQQLVHRGLVDLARQLDGTGHDLGHHAALEVDVVGARRCSRSMRPPSQRTSCTVDVDLLEALEVEAGSPGARGRPAAPSGCRRPSRR